ncbi:MULTISPECIES: hypothetical protein [Streptomyces]|uniref:Uncharacterized protein n=1 Tax=Streptomyces bangladeshensis TaxID=295352 RepID=A0ABP5NNW6_9ACTN|nr:hypothetical protein [Streptomyces sp. EAS-AB2608]BCM70908.1 hypothetical protein EASAB2608_06242 [Streptomyces sp. EAS-AB2608]
MDATDPRMNLIACEIDRMHYENGQTGLQIAEQWIVSHINALLAVTEARAQDPRTYPGFGDGTTEETARRIVARLLDAGWRPPDTECLDVPAIPTADL